MVVNGTGSSYVPLTYTTTSPSLSVQSHDSNDTLDRGSCIRTDVDDAPVKVTPVLKPLQVAPDLVPGEVGPYAVRGQLPLVAEPTERDPGEEARAPLVADRRRLGRRRVRLSRDLAAATIVARAAHGDGVGGGVLLFLFAGSVELQLNCKTNY